MKLCLHVIMVGALLAAAAGRSHADDPIAIGMSSPVTGGAAYLGQHQQWGAQLAFEEINEAGGVLGRQVELRVQDNQCNPSQAAASAEQLINVDQVVAILGALCSSGTLAVMPIIERAKIPLVVETSTSPKITEQSGIGGNDWTFRINPSDAGLAVGLAGYLKSLGSMKTIAFVGEDSDYGRGGRAALSDALKEAGIRVSDGDFFPQGTQDFSALFSRLAEERPSAIAVYMTGADELNFLRQYRSAGLEGVPLTGRVEFSELQEGVIESGALNGATSVYPYAVQIENPGNQKFVAAFKKKFNDAPNTQSYEAYTAAYVLADAIKRAGSAAPADIRNALEETEFSTILGDTLRFDEHNQAHGAAVILQINGKDVVIAGQFGT